jgi:16S rRNA (uracil1498-N3)-methyltransferase
MKEERYFYVPDAASQKELPPEEAMHALRVLRLKGGDEMVLMDGQGTFYRAVVTIAATKRCMYEITEVMPQTRDWRGRLHLVMAPTKMMERVEWFVEKATEIGVDEFSFLNCRFSERKLLRTVRLEKIVISAVKQSRKAWKPLVNPQVNFKDFIHQEREGQKFIAHCYPEVGREDLFRILQQPDIAMGDDDITILIGPEGDFSIDKVHDAIAHGYRSISLGRERLRTETAALAATMMGHLSRRIGI